MTIDGNREQKILLLVVEDNEESIELLRHGMPADVQVVYARSPGRAVRIIELDAGNVYAGIMLDHDLCEQMTLKEELGVKGQDVVRKGIRHIPRSTPVFIHSMNLGAAPQCKVCWSRRVSQLVECRSRI